MVYLHYLNLAFEFLSFCFVLNYSYNILNSICTPISRLFGSSVVFSGVPVFPPQVFMFGVAGEKLTTRIRKITFKTILKQEVAYFDDARHPVGVLCARLSSDASSVQGVSS